MLFVFSRVFLNYSPPSHWQLHYYKKLSTRINKNDFQLTIGHVIKIEYHQLIQIIQEEKSLWAKFRLNLNQDLV